MNIVNFPGQSSVWRIASPLTVTSEEIDTALAILDQAICECLHAGSTAAAQTLPG